MLADGMHATLRLNVLHSAAWHAFCAFLTAYPLPLRVDPPWHASLPQLDVVGIWEKVKRPINSSFLWCPSCVLNLTTAVRRQKRGSARHASVRTRNAGPLQLNQALTSAPSFDGRLRRNAIRKGP